MLQASRKLGIPLLIGSAGTAGADPNLEWVLGVLRKLAVEEGLHFNLAVIHAEQSREYLKRQLAEDRIAPLSPAPEISAEIIDRSEHIVGLMGVEPYIQALNEGADVVLAGRSSDVSIFAAIPIRDGFPAAQAWHAAKILECGGAAAAHTTGTGLEGMFARIRHDSFDVMPTHSSMSCTPVSVAAHTLYENRSPFHLVEPSGILDVSAAEYAAIDTRAVRVTGSAFQPAERYSIKLEGAELVGYQTIVIGGIRDPTILRQFDHWFTEVQERAQARIEALMGADAPSVTLTFRVYGLNGVLGELEPNKEITGHEVCLIVEATAATQEDATAAAYAAAQVPVHHPIAQWSGLITPMALPYAPPRIERGPVYRFNLNHVVYPDNPLEMFSIDHLEI
jgi:hypothetical protein